MGDENQEQLNALRAAWREHIDDETPFKLEATEVLRGVLEQVVGQRAEWPEFVKAKRTFLQNQIGWRAVADLEKLAGDHPEALRTAARRILDGDGAQAFFAALEDAEVDLGAYPVFRGTV